MTKTKKKVLSTAPAAGEVSRAYQHAHETLVNKIGVSVGKLPAKDLAALEAQVTQTKKNADFVAEFDGAWLTFSAVVAAKKTTISEVNVDAIGNADKVYEVKKKLAEMGLADMPVAPAEIERMRKAIVDLGHNLETSEQIQKNYQAFTWDTDSPSLHGAFYEWAAKRGQAHTIDFLAEVKGRAKPQSIFDTYVKKGAKKPVNLSPAIASAIEKDLKAGKTPNFSAAEKEVLQVVKTKLIPPFKKWGADGSAQYQKQTKTEIATLRKRLAAAGAP